LSGVLERLRGRKLRSTFSTSVANFSTEEAPIKARCVGGSLMDVVHQPVNEDVRKYEEFDSRLLRTALVLREETDPEKKVLEQPEWMSQDMPWGEDGKRKGKKKSKKKKKKKRRRNPDGAEDDEGRKRKKT